ncbi:MAG: FAD:protein FMN transferase [Pseudomonadota bacterium]
MISRRRFIQISAAAAIVGKANTAHARTHRWRGRALGADCEIAFHGNGALFSRLLAKVQTVLSSVERHFSLYDPQSSLARLNKSGEASEKEHLFQNLLDRTDRLHDQTRGVFDPTVQTLWRAIEHGEDECAARNLIGWSRIHRDQSRITLGTGQALTFNGIAQGYATDLIRDVFNEAGVERTLINIGEYAAIGEGWRLAVEDPTHGHVAAISVNDAAVATSSPGALLLTPNETHIMHPKTGRAPLWSTVTVEAANATKADALSTTFCHMSAEDIAEVKAKDRSIRRVLVIDCAGDLATI